MLNSLDIIGLFCQQYNITDNNEDFKCYSVSVNSQDIKIENEDSFKELKSKGEYYNDKYILSITLDDQDDPFTLDLVNYNYNEIQNQIDSLICIKNEESIFTIKLYIEKNQKNDYVVIYNKSLFLEYLKKLKIISKLLLIKKNIFDPNAFFLFADEEINVNNKYIFLTNNKFLEIKINDETCKYLQNNDHCNCQQLFAVLLMPDYYYFNIDFFDEFIDIFNRLSIISSFCFLFSHVEINENFIMLKTSGYKTISGTVDYEDIKSDKKIFLEISKWVYSGKNIYDKLGLFRNILSLYVTDEINQILQLEQDFFDSILSSYEIYLKENINQYIHVKSIFIDRQIDIISTINALADNIIDSLKKNFIAFLSFFMTIVILNSLSTGKIENIFNDTITVISYVLLGVSLLMLILCRMEIIYKWKRKNAELDALKEEYMDILNRNDIDNIFNKKSNIKETENYLKKSIKIVTIIWIISLILIFAGVFLLNCNYHSRQIIIRFAFV
jgi:hypothetical protein